MAGGIRIDPCIPPSWPSFEATVRVGNKRIHIRVENPDRVSRNIATITLDGVSIATDAGVVVPPADGTSEHEVCVVLGAIAKAEAAPASGWMRRAASR